MAANPAGLSLNLATIRQQWDMREAVDACVRHGIRAISPWRDQIAKVGLDEAVRMVKANGLQLTGVCRGGMFPAADKAARDAAIDDNKRAIDEAAALGADCLVLVVGGLPAGSKDIGAAREMVADGIATILPYAQSHNIPLAIEPLHPMYAADRACVNTLGQALDICAWLGEGVGVAIDVYHVWWDPDLPAQIARAGADEAHPRPPHLRLAGADARPAARPRHDGRRRHRPQEHTRHDRGRRIPRIAGSRDLFVAGLVDAPRGRGAGHMHRTARHPVPHEPGNACRRRVLGLFSIPLEWEKHSANFAMQVTAW